MYGFTSLGSADEAPCACFRAPSYFEYSATFVQRSLGEPFLESKARSPISISVQACLFFADVRLSFYF